MNTHSPTVKHLVLIGGGHSHLAVLRSLSMKPMPGLALTLISRDINTPYSGSLPGYLAGHYTLEEMHIDLRPLAQAAGACLIQCEVTNIDLANKRVHMAGRPDIPFDILSLNIGSKPDGTLIKGAEKFATPIKPIDKFIQRWEAIHDQALKTVAADKEFHFAIIGGGPASVELAFAAQARIHSDLSIGINQPSKLKVKLISADAELLSLHNADVRMFVKEELERRHVDVLLNHPVTEFEKKAVISTDLEPVSADCIVYATGATIPDWPFQCGLTKNADGFIAVKNTLQTLSHDFVFAAGDAATIEDEPRAKSGVYAVRQGKVLAENLRRFATGKTLRTYFPQRQALALMSMGNKKAIASRGKLFYQGRAMWSLKHRIDSSFVKKFSTIPQMPAEFKLESGLVDAATEKQLRQHAMRCAGCGAKLASDVLSDVLSELPAHQTDDIIVSGIEDASRIRLDDGRILVQSVDYLKAFTHDPWLFARIASNHCLSDIYAMGVQPHSALAIVGLTQANKRYSHQLMRELMLGCSEVLSDENCALVGGHTAESQELQFGLCVNSFGEEEVLLSKDSAQTNDVIILTKALGTGTLLAADMRCRANHNWMHAAFSNMLLSNRRASELIVKHHAHACTDITGFGLAGHLMEILQASGVSAELLLSNVAALGGALSTLEQGIYSSLHEDNKLIEHAIAGPGKSADNPLYQLLFDPQTAGGLLFTLPAEAAENCLQDLHNDGYPDAAIIGSVVTPSSSDPTISLK